MLPRRTTVCVFQVFKIVDFLRFHSMRPSQTLYSTPNSPNLSLNVTLKLPYHPNTNFSHNSLITTIFYMFNSLIKTLVIQSFSFNIYSPSPLLNTNLHQFFLLILYDHNINHHNSIFSELMDTTTWRFVNPYSPLLQLKKPKMKNFSPYHKFT